MNQYVHMKSYKLCLIFNFISLAMKHLYFILLHTTNKGYCLYKFKMSDVENESSLNFNAVF
jgi:hypothetical protein